MSWITREFLNNTLDSGYNSFVQCLLDAGWELFYTASASNCVLRTNCEDGQGPWIYVNIYYTTLVYVRYYQHWSGAAGVGPITNATSIAVATMTVGFRVYCNKNIVFLVVSPYTGYALAPLIIMRPPARISKVVQGPVVGGTLVMLPLLDTTGLRINERRTIYGPFGEGQREIVITAIDRDNNTITVTGCVDSYADGALVGDYQMCLLSEWGGGFYCMFPYNKIGSAAIVSASAYITGKNGAVGAPYAHDSTMTIETAIARDTYRTLGDINPTYCKWGSGLSMNSVVQIRNSDEPSVDSVPTSFTDYTLTDNTQTWVVDALINKCILFISGTGLEYSRVIIGNTEHTLTFRTKLPAITLTTGFRIVDEVYRQAGPPAQPFLCKEEF